MPAQKRSLEDSSTSRESKKTKVTDAGPSGTTESLVTHEVDFPRGGGTSFTPLEVKAIRAEAIKEANEELFESKTSKKKKGKIAVHEQNGNLQTDKNDKIRIEHLNYKRMNAGMKILGQIVSIQPLSLIVSLPHQLFAHVPITNISSELTRLLESLTDDQDDSEEEPSGEEDDSERVRKPHIPDLHEIFREGQYVRSVVTVIHAPGSTDASIIGKSRDEIVKSSRRVELSLLPDQVNAGVQMSDLKAGFTITAAVKSIEDHGYILNLGIPNISAFLPFKNSKQKGSSEGERLHIGQLLEVTLTSMSSNGRTCTVDANPDTFASSSLSELTNASSMLPGALVQTLVTAVQPTGLNLQVLGFFEGTVDQTHLRRGSPEKPIKVGKKVKARVLYSFSSTPPRFALSLSDHVVSLRSKHVGTSGTQTMQMEYPLGKVLEVVKVLKLESERGLYAEVEPGLEGFVHISHISDDHVPSISFTGPWKINSIHRARVLGYFAFDGLLQLSFKPSILEQRFIQVGDVEVGEVIKGTVKKLSDNGLFVSLSGNIDGVVWPNHYADIALKHPSKRFKPGKSIKCRVLMVDPTRKRISLTAKKTLVDSTLPVLSNFDDIEPGIVTLGVVFKVHDKHLMVEFYNNLKALVPLKEVSETPISNLPHSFPVGRVIKVRILSVERQQRQIIASIRQAASTFNPPVTDTAAVEIGDIIEATVMEVHKDNAALTLQSTGVRALISLKNLANHRGLSLPQLRVGLKAGDKLEELVVVTRNAEKGFVIVANKPRTKPSTPKGALSMESVALGQIVGGRVTRHTRLGSLVKIAAHIGGILHPTDTSDDYEAGVPFPEIDSILKAAVVDIHHAKKQLILSTRQSRMYPGQITTVIDHEVKDICDLHAGETVRGYIKSIAEHGLFVTVGRELDARVQIRELFDEYVKEWKERFTVNQLVKGRILSVDPETKKIELSFRTAASKPSSSALSIGDFQIGQKVEGIIKRIEDYGLFIQIEGSKLTGLCHKSQLSDNKDADVTVALRGFREGDCVKTIITSIEKRKISLSLKPSHFTEEDFHGVDDSRSESRDSEGEALGVIDDDEVMSSHEDVSQKDPDDASMDDTDDDEGAMDIDKNQLAFQRHDIIQKADPSPSISTPAHKLKLSGFQWSNQESQATEDDPDLSEEDSDLECQPGKKKRKRKEIEKDLTADMHTKTPESNADFERVLLGSPDSSFLWIQYLSFQLQLSEIEKAREIARRAIRTINFREEQERLNLWIAFLNLENIYGTEETLEATFREAARANDSKTVHLRLASILDEAGKREKAEEQYKRTSKKFGPSSKVWTLFGEHYMKKGNLEEARKLLPRSLQSLDKRKHLKTISRFAQLEYKHGEPERGKTLFEGIVDSHPKRWDLWSIYMDMEARQGDIQSLRNLFDRVLALKMTSHKAKFFFKKWLQLERRVGDEDGAEVVKQKAIQWTQRANAS